jgi:hypothetical protein
MGLGRSSTLDEVRGGVVYVDDHVENGKRYHYVVRGADNGRESRDSNVAVAVAHRDFETRSVATVVGYQ